jgi:hypothetical protein
MQWAGRVFNRPGDTIPAVLRRTDVFRSVPFRSALRRNGGQRVAANIGSALYRRMAWRYFEAGNAE